MKILAVHTTSPYLGVAVADEGVILSESVLPPAREHVERLAVAIDEQTTGLGISLKDIDGFGVATGPGSFSGIRVGLATVKGMALALQKPVAGVSSLGILAWQALQEGETGAAIIDARRKELYVGLYRKTSGHLTALDAPRLMAAKELLPYIERLGAQTIVCGDDSAAAVGEMTQKRIRAVTAVPSAVPCALLAWERLKRGDWDPLHALIPLYIRPADAEEKRVNALS